MHRCAVLRRRECPLVGNPVPLLLFTLSGRFLPLLLFLVREGVKSNCLQFISSKASIQLRSERRCSPLSGPFFAFGIAYFNRNHYTRGSVRKVVKPFFQFGLVQFAERNISEGRQDVTLRISPCRGLRSRLFLFLDIECNPAWREPQCNCRQQ